MIRSRSLGELNTALSAAQGEFEAVGRSAENPFFHSSYAPLVEVVKAATPILAKHGLSVWQGSDTDEKGELLWTVVLHSSGQYIGSAARMLLAKQDPQAQGSAVSYQRRYQYKAALGLVDEDDDAEAAMERKSAGRSKPSPRGRSSTRRNPQPPPAEAPSGADSGSQDAAGEQPVTEDTLKELARVYKASGATKKDLEAIAAEVGATGKTDTWSEDAATWVVLKLREWNKAA